MGNLFPQESGDIFDVMIGSGIDETISEAIALSAEKNRLIRFEFNGVIVNVNSDSKKELIYRDYSRAIRGYIDKNVGPNPNPILTDKQKESDARISAKINLEIERRERARRAEEEAKREAVNSRLVNAPEIEIRDEAGWKMFMEKNQPGSYGGAVLFYAERWAQLMQIEMAAGKNLEDVAAATSFDAAVFEGITGFMYGCAVTALSKCWKYGEQLLRWYESQ